MNRSCQALASVGLVLLLAAPARANLDRAKELLAQAREDFQDKLWTSTESLCQRIESELRDVEEGKKAPLAKEVADMKAALAARDKSEDEDLVKRARYELSRLRRLVVAKQFYVVEDHCKSVTNILDEEKDNAKKACPDATRAEILKKVEEYRTAGATGMVDQKFAHAEKKLEEWEDMKGQTHSSDYANKVRWAHDVEEEILRLPQDDPRAKQMRDRLAKDKAGFEQKEAAAKLDEGLAYLEKNDLRELEDQSGEKGSWWYENKLKKFPDVEEKIAKLSPQTDARVVGMKARVAKLKATYEKAGGASGRDEVVKPAQKGWDETKAKIAKECEGWEKCALPAHVPGKLDELDNLGYASFKKCTDRIYEVDQFERHGHMAEAARKQPDDPDVKKIQEEMKKIRAETATVICRLVAEAFTRCEQEGQKDHTQSLFKVKNLSRDLEHQWQGKHSPDFAATIAKGKALADKWEGVNAAAAATKADWEKKLRETCDAYWNDETSRFSDPAIEDALDCVRNMGSWKGKRVRFKNVGNQLEGEYDNDGSYAFVYQCKGTPICFVLDASVKNARKEMEAATGVQMNRYPDPIEDVIGIVDGTAKVQHQAWSPIRNQHYATGEWTEGPLVRVTSYKCTPFAIVEGRGTNMSRISGAPSIGVSGGGSGGWFGYASEKSAGEAWLGRLAAYANSFGAFLGGLLAIFIGISGYVPQVQDFRVKAGNYLGYAGAALAAWGLFWLLGWLVVCDFFPAGALLLAGGFVGLDIARAKGKIAEETFVKAQPVGILLGLGAWLFAGVHVLFWDWWLL